ncbi:MAG: hypothetical protein HC881_22165 [Leptolyngbyaceae cyanobacterium SL_7_1]|nr:hypothetical protein [Leptolyngbyaceae cyanobacterium SL_7_1]
MNNLALAVVGLLVQGLIPPESVDRLTVEPVGSDPAIAPPSSPNPRLIKSQKQTPQTQTQVGQPEFSLRSPFSLATLISPNPDLPPLPPDSLITAWNVLPQTIVAPRSIPPHHSPPYLR